MSKRKIAGIVLVVLGGAITSFGLLSTLPLYFKRKEEKVNEEAYEEE